ncbi:MAG: hypothetical protein KY468_20830 [Armatimonadetes bacterium]|nr:hypothetical protein [Armatimonadota bacterium]
MIEKSPSTVKYDVEVQNEGRIEVTVPYPAGSQVVVYVFQGNGGLSEADLLNASLSSTDFWDNPLDDEDWNHA